MDEFHLERVGHDVNQLVASYWNTVRAYALRMTRNAQDADDVTIRTFEQLYIHMRNHPDKPIMHLSAWLRTVVRNLTFNEDRKSRGVSTESLEQLGVKGNTDDDMPTFELKARYEDQPENIVEYQENEMEKKHELQQRIKEMNIPDKIKQDTWLYLDGYSYHEIAQARQLPLGTIRHRVRSTLNGLLGLTTLPEEINT